MNKLFFQKKLLYRSKNRGCKEMDYIFSKFAKQYLSDLNEKKLQQYALILDQADNDLYNWITNKLFIPSYINTEIIDVLRCLARTNYK